MGVNYTVINHTAREQLGLSWIEYGLVDLIHNLSNSPQSVARWCYASKKSLAEMLGVTERYVLKMIPELVEKGLIEKHPATKHLRTTQLWHDTVTIKDGGGNGEKNTKLHEQSSYPMNKVHPDHEQSSPYHEQSSYNKDNIQRNNKDKEKENKKKNLASPDYLKNIPEQDILELQEICSATGTQVQDKAHALYDYCLARGRRYKDYKAFLRNALRQDYPRVTPRRFLADMVL